MKKEILLELASKWNEEVFEKRNEVGQDSEEFRIMDSRDKGKREGISECAKKLIDLVHILG